MSTKKSAKPKSKKSAKLTHLQKRFVDLILKGHNQSDAYIKAGYKSKPQYARIRASELVSKQNIKKAIATGQKKANEAAIITQKRILEEESRLAFYDPKELFDENGRMLPVHLLPENIRRAIHGVEVIHTTLGETKYKYKFHEKGKSLDRLEKIEGMHQPEKHQLDGELTIKWEK